MKKNINNNANYQHGCFSTCIIVLSMIITWVFFPISVFFAIKIVEEYERVIIFRLGLISSGKAKGPGLFFVNPFIDECLKTDLRTKIFDMPPQEIITKDAVSVAVDAVVFYRIVDPILSITAVGDVDRGVRMLSQTTLRNCLGIRTLSELLQQRDTIVGEMQNQLDVPTDLWGVKVERVEIKDVRLPYQLQRAMAAEAEASRDARAKVIAAEGERNAARSMKEAAEVIAKSPTALQLRFLQTLTSISAENNSTVIIPLPIEILRKFC